MILKTAELCFLSFLVMWVGGCVAPALQGDVDVLNRKINRQKRELQIVRQQQAELVSRLDTLQNEFQRMQGRIEESRHYAQKASDDVISLSEGLTSTAERYEQELNQIQEEIRTIKTLLGMKVASRKEETVKSIKERIVKEDTAALPTEALAKVAGSPDPEELYNSAYSKLSKGDYKEAREEFKKFLELFPRTEYSDNAQFWIGESYYREKRYEEAIIEFEEVIKKYPEGNKVPDAQLKQAFSFIALKDTNSAKLLLQKIIDRYPASDQAEIARAKLKSLK